MQFEPAKAIERIRFGEDFELDLRSYELRRAQRVLKLERIPTELLLLLIEEQGRLVTRDQIIERVWGKKVFVDTDSGINAAIRKIRAVLKDNRDKPRFIQTISGRGYRFIAPVDALPAKETRQLAPISSAGAEARHIRCLAVLPLEDHSGGLEHEYFADGMTEALISSLAKVKALRVISRTSAMQYKGVKKLLPEIARELNVDGIIEGSILRSGKRIRVAAQLIHAASDQHLWAETYERDFQDVLALQSEIARQVAHEVRAILTPEDQARLGNPRQLHPAAHDLYLRARYHWNKRTEESVKKALTFFHQAIDIDPRDAQGYAGLADCYNILGYYNTLPPKEAYPKGKAAAEKAVQLDGTAAEPHATLGVVKRDFEWDWRGAEQEFQLAIERNPGYMEAYHWRSTLFSILGRHEEAIAEKQRALAMDPLSVVVRTDLGRMFYFAGEYEQALGQYRAALDMDSNFSFAHLWLAHIYEQQGKLAEAIKELQIGLRLSSDSSYALARLGHCYGLQGDVKAARGVLTQLEAVSKQKYVSPHDIAIVYVGLREDDKAFAWLQRALEERSLWLGYLNVEPQFDRLRPDSRFKGLLQRVGLEPQSA